MNPRHFLEVARELAAIDSPAKCRTAISRAYYALFNVAAEFLMRDLGFALAQNASDQDHIYVWLNNCGDMKVAETARQLHGLRVMRNRADYKMSDVSPGKQSVANYWADIADKAIAELHGCRKDFSRSGDIKVAIRNHQRDNPS